MDTESPDTTSEEVEVEAVYGDEDFDFEAFYAEYERKLTGETPADTPEETEEEPEEPAAEEPTVGGESDEESGAESGSPATINIGGEELAPEEVERLAAMYRWMTANPEKATQFVGYLTDAYELVPKGTQPPQPEPQAPPAPSWDEDDDENWAFVPEALKQRIKTLDQQYRETQERLATYEQYVEAEQERYLAAAREQANSAVNSGIEKFRESYDITDAEVEQLRQEAAALGVAPTLNAQYNDPVRATYEALELAYLRNPEYREREMDRKLQELQVDTKRQRKLAAIGGQGGSAPAKQPKVPSTPDEVREAMVRDIAAAMNGS